MIWSRLIEAASPWYADPIWGWIGTVAQVLSLVALAFAVVEVMRQRRSVPDVVWGLDLIGTASTPKGAFHAVDFYNGGKGTAHVTAIAFVDCAYSPDEERRPRTVMGPGDRVTLLVTAAKIESAWVLIMWRSHSDWTLAEYQWLPISRSGGMSDAWDASATRTYPRGFRATRGRNSKPVGPLHYARSSVRWQEDSPATEASHARVFEGISSAGKVRTWGLGSTTPVPNLPVVSL